MFKRLLALRILAVILVLAVATTACSPTAEKPARPADSETSSEQPDGISWQAAAEHVGENVTIEGPVVSTRYASSSRGQPTFLNIGRPYPDTGRFTVVIWVENRGNFSSPPEDHYDGKTIAVSGVLDTYEGVPQMEVSSPDQIEER